MLRLVRHRLRVVMDPEQDHRQLEEYAIEQDHQDRGQPTEDEPTEESSETAAAHARERNAQPHQDSHDDHHDVHDLYDRWCDELLETEVEEAS